MRNGFFSLLLMGLLGTSSAMAANYGTAGCGLGAVIFKDEPGKIQILAATVNNLVSPQTSAITSGTSNCYDGGSKEEAKLFIAVNQEALRNDISRGNGETLASLSRILKCDDAEKLGVNLQRNYQTIFPNNQSTPADINASIESAIKSDQELATSCASVV